MMADRYEVFGNPINHSLSPAIHRRFAEQSGENISYDRQLVALDKFSQTATEFFEEGGCGLNITVPFKLDAYGFADHLSKRARQAGAVNTLMREADGTLRGDNTDGVGLVRDLIENLGWQLTDKNILLLGAGGAARGVLAPLLDVRPASLVIANRTLDKAQQLAVGFKHQGEVSASGYSELAGRGFQVIINATSAGLSGELPDLPGKIIEPGACAYDMIYGAEPTPFMQWAQAQDAGRVADGLGMLVEQAAESFYIWRHVRPLTKNIIDELRQEITRKLI